MYYYKKNQNKTEQLFDREKTIQLRHELHQNPELSGSEFITSERIVGFLSKYKTAEIIRGIGGHGIACIFKGSEDGPSVLLRCDMDALPIDETNDFDYISKEKGVSHMCGHDGHMAIMAGLADTFSKRPPEKGQAVLLFQPSEENGQGALSVLKDKKFKDLKIDYVFALHNLPGFQEGEILLRNEIFASASKGITIKLIGRASHAAEPENGISPAIAMADIIKQLNELSQKKNLFTNFVLITIVCARMGEVAFGTAPGHAVVHATLRSGTNDDMQKLTSYAEAIAKENAEKNNLKFEISYTEEFPATVNNAELVKDVEEVAKSNNVNFKYLNEPFRWSEDFGHFTQKYPGVLFGLGSGENHSQLHNPDYDFPDEIIEKGVSFFHKLYLYLTNLQHNLK